jgi:thiol-disulfide isomerase/thioredoxin
MRSFDVIPISVCSFAARPTAGETGPAAAAWSHLEDLNAKAREEVPVGVNAVEFYSDRDKALHDAAADFVRKFPNDAHEPQAVLWKLETTDFPDDANQKLALLHQNELEAKSLEENTTIPADFRYGAEHILLMQWLDNSDLISSGDQATAIENRIATLLRTNPAEPQTVTFQLGSANLMLRFDHDRGIALLEELGRASDKNLANAAAAQLRKAQIIGKPIELRFTAADGSSVDLATLRGSVVLIDFWASWCPDCIRETPTVKSVYEKYKDKGFAVIGISLDKDEQAMSNYIAKKLIPWPQYFDGKGWANDFATKFGVHAIPDLWLINQHGEVTATGASAKELDSKLAQLLGQSQNPPGN